MTRTRTSIQEQQGKAKNEQVEGHETKTKSTMDRNGEDKRKKEGHESHASMDKEMETNKARLRSLCLTKPSGGRSGDAPQKSSEQPQL